MKFNKYSVTLVVFGLILFAPVCFAEPSSLVAFDKETRALLKSGDIERGEALSSKKKCTKCHGDAGIAEEDDEANLAGQIPSYILKQLMDYKSEHREDRDMKKAMRKLNEQEMADLAQYYGSLELPAAARVGDEAVIKLAKKGDHTRMLKSCNSCHGQRGQGDAFETPAISGLKREYFVDTIVAMQEEDRTNDIYSRMRLIAKVLTEEEIEGLATYYAQPVQAAEE